MTRPARLLLLPDEPDELADEQDDDELDDVLDEDLVEPVCIPSNK